MAIQSWGCVCFIPIHRVLLTGNKAAGYELKEQSQRFVHLSASAWGEDHSTPCESPGHRSHRTTCCPAQNTHTQALIIIRDLIKQWWVRTKHWAEVGRVLFQLQISLCDARAHSHHTLWWFLHIYTHNTFSITYYDYELKTRQTDFGPCLVAFCLTSLLQTSE